MFTRIKYQSTGNNKYKSIKPILCEEKLVEVHLDVDRMEYNIINLVNNKSIANGISTTLYNLKRDAKNTLKSLGVVFKSEIRKDHDKRKLILSTEDNRLDIK